MERLMSEYAVGTLMNYLPQSNEKLREYYNKTDVKNDNIYLAQQNMKQSFGIENSMNDSEIFMLFSTEVPMAAEPQKGNISEPNVVNSLLISNESFNEIISNFNNFSNYSCDGSMESTDSVLSSVYFKVLVYLLYIPTFFFALVGNGLVCYIVKSTPRMHTVTNYFIANLAVGDILMSLFCVPFSFVSIFILGYWPFGIALCYLVNYSQAISVLVSAYTLVAISFDRYIAIMWPLRPRITKRLVNLHKLNK